MELPVKDYDYYWESIPIGKSNAIDYTALCCLWGCGDRQVRNILSALEAHDNDDEYALIRSSKNKGFYRTSDKDEIYSYERESHGRALSILSATKKCRRLLGEVDGQMTLDSLIELLREESVPERNKSEETAT